MRSIVLVKEVPDLPAEWFAELAMLPDIAQPRTSAVSDFADAGQRVPSMSSSASDIPLGPKREWFEGEDDLSEADSSLRVNLGANPGARAVSALSQVDPVIVAEWTCAGCLPAPCRLGGPAKAPSNRRAVPR